jgi:hypothetical protein
MIEILYIKISENIKKKSANNYNKRNIIYLKIQE